MRMPLALLTALSAGAAAAGPCSTLAAAMEDPRPPAALRMGDQGFTCSTFQRLGAGAAASCVASFPFRSGAARALAQDLAGSLALCASSERAPGDRPVNHPDSFELQVFELGDGRVSVSVKDKGAHQRTLVFVTFDRP